MHELYFSNLKPGGESRPSDRQAVGRALAESYGSVDQWQANFQALGGMRGIGRVILYQDPVNGRLVNQWISLHQDGSPARWKPILVMDVWEHAFMRDYKATERAKYVDAFFKSVDWSTVDQRLREAPTVRSRSGAGGFPAPATATPSRRRPGIRSSTPAFAPTTPTSTRAGPIARGSATSTAARSCSTSRTWRVRAC